MSQSVQDHAQLGEEDMGEAFGPLPVNKLEVSDRSRDCSVLGAEQQLTLDFHTVPTFNVC